VIAVCVCVGGGGCHECTLRARVAAAGGGVVVVLHEAAAVGVDAGACSGGLRCFRPGMVKLRVSDTVQVICQCSTASALSVRVRCRRLRQ
jgi:hypothetical protein